MSSLANWAYTQPLTVWPRTGYDEWSQPIYGSPYLLTGSWSSRTEVMTNDAGQEFTSRSIYYFELPDGDERVPQMGEQIMRGDHTLISTPPDNAEQIQSVRGDDMRMFGATEIPDWQVVT